MKVRGLKVSNPYGAFTYDVAVVFVGSETTVEVRANTMTEAAALVEKEVAPEIWTVG